MTCIVSLRLLTGGGRVAVSRTLVTQHGAPPEVGSATGVAEQIAALRAPAENKAAVAWLDETLAQFNSTYVAVSGRFWVLGGFWLCFACVLGCFGVFCVFGRGGGCCASVFTTKFALTALLAS